MGPSACHAGPRVSECMDHTRPEAGPDGDKKRAFLYSC